MHALQAQRVATEAEREKAKRTAQQLLALAHQTSKVTESYEVCPAHAVNTTPATCQPIAAAGPIVRHIVVCLVHMRLSRLCCLVASGDEEGEPVSGIA